jgi:hypothetical protein
MLRVMPVQGGVGKMIYFSFIPFCCHQEGFSDTVTIIVCSPSGVLTNYPLCPVLMPEICVGIKSQAHRFQKTAGVEGGGLLASSVLSLSSQH